MTAQPRFDGTFSCDAVALAAHALVAQLHDDAMATIAALAEGWDRPAEDAPAPPDEPPVTYRDPATWSVDDEDEPAGYADDEDPDDAPAEDEVRVVPRLDLPPLLPHPRRATAGVVAANVAASAPTDEFVVPAPERQYAAS
ncbi:hypothetical protein [Modestobacter versicolor]|uniref:hypothetical protein n=1 Tax=Modestobacter versicolor TaxID=429133 RepID=UPI0034E05588